MTCGRGKFGRKADRCWKIEQSFLTSSVKRFSQKVEISVANPGLDILFIPGILAMYGKWHDSFNFWRAVLPQDVVLPFDPTSKI
jgi:hypothetical protein